MFAQLFLVGLLAAISPGPDFLLVTRLSLGRGRQGGVMAALGVGTGLGAHLAYTLCGAVLLLERQPALFAFVQAAGAGYLMWLGLGALKAAWRAWRQGGSRLALDAVEERSGRGLAACFRDGFVCNALNPKAVLFFLSVFSQFLAPGDSAARQATMGLTVILAVTVWFTFLSLVIGGRTFRRAFERFGGLIDGLFGALLNYFGVRILLRLDL